MTFIFDCEAFAYDWHFIFKSTWRCQPDRDDYSDFEKCEEGRKRWLKQPAEGE